MERVTAGWLRARASEAGYPVSGDNFDGFRTWGVVPEPDDDGLYPADALQAIVRARELGAEPGLKMLYRRVVRLRCEGFPVPDAKLVDALAKTAATLQRPARTMTAVRQVRARVGNPTATKPSRRAAARERLEGWQPPPPERWREVMSRVIAEAVGARFGLWCYLGGAILHHANLAEDELTGIPLHDVVALLAVHDAAAALANADAGWPEPRIAGPIVGRLATIEDH